MIEITVGTKMSKLNGRKHRNSQTLEFEPGGPPELEKKRRVLRTTYLIVLLRSCAPKCLKCCWRDPEMARNRQNHDFQELLKIDIFVIFERFGSHIFALSPKHGCQDLIPDTLKEFS